MSKPSITIKTYGKNRFCIINNDSGEVLDDANGHGYRTMQGAYKSFWFCSKYKTKEERRAATKRLTDKKLLSRSGVKCSISNNAGSTLKPKSKGLGDLLVDCKINSFGTDRFCVIDDHGAIILHNNYTGYQTRQMALDALANYLLHTAEKLSHH